MSGRKPRQSLKPAEPWPFERTRLDKALAAKVAVAGLALEAGLVPGLVHGFETRLEDRLIACGAGRRVQLGVAGLTVRHALVGEKAHSRQRHFALDALEMVFVENEAQGVHHLRWGGDRGW